MRKVLILVKSAPYGSTNLGEGLRAAIALAGMDTETTILLTQDAVYSIVKGQAPNVIGMTSLEESFENAKQFGAKLLVHVESLRERGLVAEELLDVETVTTEKMAELVREVDATITF